ncbi:MAG: hypothetical protein QOD54_1385 [Sphingomonadales bacterium]|jgi:hypothetical protein|nr:hypothetical protein [Sphingomonadales bacterium]
MEQQNDSPEPNPNRPARTQRRDGWTVARQEAFLKALAACGCIAHAARAVGMSRQSFYDLHDRPDASAFRRAVEAALDCSANRIDEGAFSRSINGVPRPIFYKGEQVGEYRHFDERLTMFLLRYRRPHRYGAHLDRLPVAMPERLPGCSGEIDPDEAVGDLEWHLGDLVDEADLPGGADPDSRTNDGVNFVNFTPAASLPAPEAPGPDRPGDDPLPGAGLRTGDQAAKRGE